jgi:hypothetical protein
MPSSQSKLCGVWIGIDLLCFGFRLFWKKNLITGNAQDGREKRSELWSFRSTTVYHGSRSYFPLSRSTAALKNFLLSRNLTQIRQLQELGRVFMKLWYFRSPVACLIMRAAVLSIMFKDCMKLLRLESRSSDFDISR